MNLVADESVDGQIVYRLRKDGHRVWYVAEELPSITDHDVLCIAQQQNAVLVTADKDFGELVYRLRQAMSGVVLIRLAGMRTDEKAALVSFAFQKHEVEMANAFSVIGRRTIRIRQTASGGVSGPGTS